MEFNEEYQRFIFNDNWTVIKYDDDPAYRERIGKLSKTKSLDFIGLYDNDLYLIEVKDYRNHRIPNQPRLIKGELAIILGQKVRDTIAGIIGAYRTSNPQKWDGFAHNLIDRNRVIRVVLWLEYDMPPHPEGRRKVRASVENKVFKKQLKWLTGQVIVVNQSDNILPGVDVQNLSRPQNP